MYLMKAKTVFSYADVKSLNLSGRSKIKAFIEEVFNTEGKPLSALRIVFCSDAFLLEINRSHLGHDYYTDVITFDFSEGEEIVGEVYISVDRVKENANTYKQTFRRELLRVIFHAVLHLCGYKDKTKSEITLMRQKEEQYLCLFDNHK